MSNLEDHDAEQAEITAECTAGTCDHPECKPDTWHQAAIKVFDGAVRHDDNAERAARVTLTIYPGYDNDTLETAISDVLSDIRHLCDLMGWRFADLDRVAFGTYRKEVDATGVAKNEALRTALDNDLQ